MILGEIIDRGPLACGFASGVWNAALIGRVIAKEFEVPYTARHVRRLLEAIGFSVPWPKRTNSGAGRPC